MHALSTAIGSAAVYSQVADAVFVKATAGVANETPSH